MAQACDRRQELVATTATSSTHRDVLRTVYELEERGVVPLRHVSRSGSARSGPTVSQTVARMERDGLVQVADDGISKLTTSPPEATGVMRKHRIAERLCLPTSSAWTGRTCTSRPARWEHVMSEAVERRIVALLDNRL